MDVDSDDDYENVNLSDYRSDNSNESEAEDDADSASNVDNTPASSPPSAPSTSTARRSKKTLKCHWENCNKSFNRQARLKEHLRSHTNERPFKCSYFPCKKAFLRDSHLKHHVKSQHLKQRDHQCTWEGCDATFVTATRLRRHVETHEGRDRFRCHECDQTFRKQGTLDRHILSVHQNIKPFPCQELDSVTGQPCTKAYDTAEKLRTHQRAKHDPTRFSCDECKQDNEINRAAGNLNEIVKESFATYGEFQAHLKIVHPPTCPQCPTSFGTNKELTRHLEIQHGILPATGTKQAPAYPCTYDGCNKTFTKKGNLNVHVKTVHENRRDFVCGQTEILLPDDLQTEEQVVVEGCNRTFTSKASLEEHVRTAHLGLESKRMTREKKRKASESIHIEGTVLKKRKPRKDKGVKKTSAMNTLTGVSVPQKQEDFLYYGHYDPDTGDVDNNMMDGGEEEGLTSSMTILGNEIYHYDNVYHYPSGEYPTSNPPPNLTTSAANGSRNAIVGPQTSPAIPEDDNIFPFEDFNLTGETQYLVNDGFYDAFERQTSLEPLSAFPLD